MKNSSRRASSFVWCTHCDEVYHDSHIELDRLLIDPGGFRKLKYLKGALRSSKHVCKNCNSAFWLHMVEFQEHVFSYAKKLKKEDHQFMVLLSFQEPENYFVKRYFERIKETKDA